MRSDARKRLDGQKKAEPDADEREALIDVLVMTPMADHIGTDIAPVERTADAVLAAGYSRTPDAHLAAAKAEGAAEALEEAAASVDLSAYYDPSPAGRVSTSCHLAENATRDFLRARAARLREQGGE